ncbi:MAG TPA: MOSC domain-containing protein [Candidatus Micrarchaeia archaeon]|nr:MOSC domain-containing protein [Candidatus Micrarchaeia archaeon]
MAHPHCPGGAAVEGSTAERGAARCARVYGRAVPSRVVGGPFADAVSAFCDHPVELVRSDQLGAAVDVLPLTLASTASADRLAEHAGDPRLADGRRFRMLLELAGCTACEEGSWAGRLVRVGDALIRVVRPVPRCGVTQQDPDTGTFQLQALRTLAADRGRGPNGRSLHFGMHAEVAEPGWVRVGDGAEPQPAS